MIFKKGFPGLDLFLGRRFSGFREILDNNIGAGEFFSPGVSTFHGIFLEKAMDSFYEGNSLRKSGWTLNSNAP